MNQDELARYIQIAKDTKRLILQVVYDRLANEPGDEHIRAMQIVRGMMEETQ
ncbi:MAG: hypothetical protein ACKV2Q_36680 [Planctomycetaceae bacterium]